jgi:translation initiation factor 3 subunit L
VQNIARQREHCAKLLAMSLELAGRRLQMMGDDTLITAMSQRVKADEREMLTLGNEDALGQYKSFFMQACPRFILPSAALDLDMFAEQGKNEALALQLSLFLRNVRQQRRLPVIRSYLKLYSTMPLSKLADFCQLDKEVLRVHMHQYKHKTNQLAWSDGSVLDGTRVPSADVDFYLDDDMIHIADIKIERNFGEYFVHSLQKLQSS